MTPELKEKLLRKAKDRDPFSTFNHVQIIDIDEGYARVELAVEAETLNRWGQIHGGAMFTLADIACGAAVIGIRQEVSVTVSSTMDFMAPAGDVKKLIAIGTVTRAGKRTCFCQADILTEDDRLVARCHSVWAFMGQPL